MPSAQMIQCCYLKPSMCDNYNFFDEKPTGNHSKKNDLERFEDQIHNVNNEYIHKPHLLITNLSREV